MLLWDPALIGVWWDPEQVWSLTYDWTLDTTYISPLANALRNPLVAVGIKDTSEINAWIQSALSDGGYGYGLLFRVAEQLANRWFGVGLGDYGNAETALAIFAKVSRRRDVVVMLAKV